MVDYSKLSDFEINKLVALAEGAYEVADGLFVDDVRRYQFHPPKNKGEQKFFFDPCNNPADAWPIIKQSKLWMREIDGYWHVAGFPNKNSEFKYFDKKLFRAAMIVFLMMQDAKNG